MEDFKFYEVGGKIRDELLGLTNKDVDYVAVPTEAVYSKIHPCEAQLMFKALKSYLEEQKFEIFLVTPIVEPGNLYDDLSRRDFTINAMAKDPDTGEIIDYFGGLEDIKEKLLRTPIVTFDDDPLRILRGIRFSITKRLRVSEDMWQAYDYFDKMPVVSEERIREELTKCFKCNSSLALGWLSELTELRDYIFTKTSLWLKPTNEK